MTVLTDLLKPETVLDFFYPKECPVCLDRLKPGKELICPECRKKIRYVSGATCYKCGKPLSDETKEFCRDCAKRELPWIYGISYAEYSSKYIRRMLSEVKYHNGRQLLDWPCLDFAKRIKNEVDALKADALIPIPVHEKRFRERGYNQAAEIAERLSKEWKIPVDSEYLTRTENTKAQKELSREERMKNLRTAFCVNGAPKKYRRVILVDDIYTTGSTMESCTNVLIKAGIPEVYFVTLATQRDR